ncbi:MAG: FtsQ-type POTRA domain-containing protein [Candidatus Desulfofervidaceae bacterium]|nr:FtsQ-type POTRA domain-containing protein [Candidatus Desulfofervidaceae bacterium]MDL1969637.1 FtsQ-type POTRA domain-containing protein [Candidatus Desulfofervidaceae bacterium]
MPYFVIKDIQIEGNKSIPTKEITKLVTCQGKSLLALNAQKIRHQLSQHPLIKGVEIKRIWPNKMKIVIKEHQIVALAYIENRWWLVDKEGECIPTTTRKGLDLPVITGLSSQNDPHLKTALALIDAWSHKQKSFSLENISEVHVDVDLGINVFTLQGWQVLIGNGNFAKKLDTLVKILAYLQKNGKQVKFIDLTDMHRIYAKLGKK